MSPKDPGPDAGDEALWSAAVAAQSQGDLHRAAALYRRILERGPEQADALVNLGAVLRAQGDIDAAITYFERAIALQPGRGDFWFNFGNAREAAGDLSEAAECFERACDLAPDLGPAWFNHGRVLRRLGQAEAAVEALNQAVALLPKLARASIELGSAYRALGRLEEAEACQRKALALDRGSTDAAHNLANVLAEQGRSEDARAGYEAVLAQDPKQAEALVNLADLTPLDAEGAEAAAAIALLERACVAKPDLASAHLALGRRLEHAGDWERARSCLNRAAALAPDDHTGLHVLADALQRQGDYAAAVEAYRRALVLAPDDAALINDLAITLKMDGRAEVARQVLERATGRLPENAALRRTLGTLLVSLGRAEDGIPELERAAALDPQDTQAHSNLANALILVGRLGAAIAACDRAMALAPDSPEVLTNRGFAMTQQGRLAEAMIALAAGISVDPKTDLHHSNLLFTANYRDDLSAETLWELHQGFGARVRETHLALKVTDRTPARRLRVGYVSPDFRRHSVAYFAEALLAAHDPAAVEIFCYAVLRSRDQVSERFQAIADHWVEVQELSPKDLAERIRDDRIDILVDLAGHTAGNRLRSFAHKPAPICVTAIGFPNSTGLPAIDYRLTDAVADPPGVGDAFHSETLLRLPRCFLAYRPPEDAPAVAAPPCKTQNSVTFGSFNALPKVTPAVVTLWARILAEVPGSRLMLKALSFADKETSARYRGLFIEAGIAGDRLDLLAAVPGTADHLALYGSIDIALDPFPYNGTTTTCEALWMGVPVVTLAGERHAGRVGASLLRAVGLGELVAKSAEDYLAIAKALAADRAALADQRAALRQRMANSPLCDAEGLARAVEAAYRGMWRRYLTADGAMPTVASAEPEPDYQRIVNLMATDFAAAELQIREATQRWPDSFRGQLTLAFLCNFRKDHAGAVAALERALEVEPDSALAKFNLGYCRDRLGQTEAALTQYREATELSDGRGADAETQAAACLHRLGLTDEAFAAYQHVLETQPAHTAALYGQMRAFREANDERAAEDTARRLQTLLSEQPARAGELVSWFNRYDFHGWAALDDKAALLQHVAGLRAARREDAFPYLPESFVLPDHQDRLEAAHQTDDVWILKPTTLFGGQGIHLIDDPKAVPDEPGWLAQRYIAEPMLLDGRKFHLRLYLLVAGVAPPCLALWEDGVVRLAVEPYRLDCEALGEVERHVTNSVRFRDHPGMHLSADPDREDEGNVWSLSALLERVAETPAERERLRAGLLGLAEAVAGLIDYAGLLAAQRRDGLRFAYSPKLLGLDVLLDRDGRPWLLEIEAFPALGGGAAALVDRLHERLFRSVAAIAIATGQDSASADGLWEDWRNLTTKHGEHTNQKPLQPLSADTSGRQLETTVEPKPSAGRLKKVLRRLREQ